VTRLVKKFLAFYETRKFITVFTWSQTSLIQSNVRLNIIPLYSPVSQLILPSGFPNKTLCAFFISPSVHVYRILEFITLITFGEECKL
jgi:hypothetical protein